MSFDHRVFDFGVFDTNKKTHASKIIDVLCARLRTIDPTNDDEYYFKVNSVTERPEEFEPGDFDIAHGKTQLFVQSSKTTITEETAENIHHDMDIFILAARSGDPERAVGTRELRGDISRSLAYDILKCVMSDWKFQNNGAILVNDNFEPVEYRTGVSGALCLASVYFIARFTTWKTGASEPSGG